MRDFDLNSLIWCRAPSAEPVNEPTLFLKSTDEQAHLSYKICAFFIMLTIYVCIFNLPPPPSFSSFFPSLPTTSTYQPNKIFKIVISKTSTILLRLPPPPLPTSFLYVTQTLYTLVCVHRSNFSSSLLYQNKNNSSTHTYKHTLPANMEGICVPRNVARGGPGQVFFFFFFK